MITLCDVECKTNHDILDFHYAAKMVGSSIKPQEGMSYDVIFYSYTVSVIICGILFALDRYNVEMVKGFWIVFSPFLPCWLWVYKNRLLNQKQTLKAKSE